MPPVETGTSPPVPEGAAPPEPDGAIPPVPVAVIPPVPIESVPPAPFWSGAVFGTDVHPHSEINTAMPDALKLVFNILFMPFRSLACDQGVTVA